MKKQRKKRKKEKYYSDKVDAKDYPGRLTKTILTDYKFFFLSIFVHIYLVSVISVILTVEDELQAHVGISKSAFINYIAILSIIMMAISLSIQWTWPLLAEQVILISLIWIIYGNLLSTECLCCHESNNELIQSTSFSSRTSIEVKTEEEQIHENVDNMVSNILFNVVSTCSNSVFQSIYSAIFILLLFVTFFVDVSYRPISLFLLTISLFSFILLVLIPNNCNQFSFTSVTILLLKITLFHVIWHTNRYLRMTEYVLYDNYFTLYWNLQLEKRNKKISTNEDISITIEPDRAYFIIKHVKPEPLSLFHFIRDYRYRINKGNIIQEKEKGISRQPIQKSKKKSRRRKAQWDFRKNNNHNHLREKLKETNFKMATIDFEYYTNSNIFNRSFSWKNRSYKPEFLIVIDLIRTTWVLAVCPWFLLISIIEMLWLWKSIYNNSSELWSIENLLIKNSEIV
jgi:hypothetical protein